MITEKPNSTGPSPFFFAHFKAQSLCEQLQKANSKANALESLVLMPIIKQAAEIEIALGNARQARISQEKNHG